MDIPHTIICSTVEKGKMDASKVKRVDDSIKEASRDSSVLTVDQV